MDHKRNLLIAALAVVSYFLLLAWNKDFPSTVVSAESTSAATVVTPATTASPVADLPSAPVTQGEAGAEPLQGAKLATVEKPVLISVSTPIQKVMIDPVGGDIVSLSLPKHPTSLDTPAEPFPLLRQDNTGVYVAQSGLVGRNGVDGSSKGRPVYHSTQSAYSVESGELTVDLEMATDSMVEITKRFVFSSTDYLVRQQIIVKNHSDAEWRAAVFGQLKRDSAPDPSGQSGVRLNNFLGAVLTSADEPYIKIKLDDMEKKREPVSGSGGWIGFSQHYFLSAWIPSANEVNQLSVRKNEKGEHLMGFVGAEQVIPAGQTHTFESALWAGPKNQDRLEEIAPNLGLTIDYGKLWFVAYPIFQLLSWINNMVGNYGVAIILLTIVIRTLFYPLSAKQFASAAGMRKLQPKMEELKNRYGEDKQKLMQAQMELWKKEGVSPFSGCLPMLLQMPVFLGIYWVLNESVELRQAPFYLWYRDLSVIDPYFLLPLVLGVVNYIQQHLNPMPSSDPVQARMMKFMPVAFTIFFLWLPAGLVLYYFANALLGIFQQAFFNARYKPKTVSD